MIYVDKGKQFPLNSAHPTQSKECSADSNTSQSTNTIMPANQQSQPSIAKQSPCLFAHCWMLQTNRFISWLIMMKLLVIGN
jgi:hypothetical protein